MSEIERNALQDGLLVAADNKCSAYVNSLSQRGQTPGAILGTLEAVLSGAAALVPGATIARSLSGSAGILKGARSEFDQGRFLNTVVTMIVNEIDTCKERLKRSLLANQTQPVSAYGVRRAVADAVQYHHACSMMNGLLEANDSLSLRKYAVSEKMPGMESLERDDRQSLASVPTSDDSVDDRTHTSASLSETTLPEHKAALPDKQLSAPEQKAGKSSQASVKNMSAKKRSVKAPVSASPAPQLSDLKASAQSAVTDIKSLPKIPRPKPLPKRAPSSAEFVAPDKLPNTFDRLDKLLGQ